MSSDDDFEGLTHEEEEEGDVSEEGEEGVSDEEGFLESDEEDDEEEGGTDTDGEKRTAQGIVAAPVDVRDNKKAKKAAEKLKKKFSKEKLEKAKENYERRGIVYISRIPPHMVRDQSSYHFVPLCLRLFASAERTLQTILANFTLKFQFPPP